MGNADFTVRAKTEGFEEAARKMREMNDQANNMAYGRGSRGRNPVAVGFGREFTGEQFGRNVGSGVIENIFEQGAQELMSGIQAIIGTIDSWNQSLKEAAREQFKLTMQERQLDTELERARAEIGGAQSRADIADDRALAVNARARAQRAREGRGIPFLDTFDQFRDEHRDSTLSKFFLGTTTSRSQMSQLLSGVPDFANGGVVKASPGGTIIRAGEGGRDEAIVPLTGGRSEVAQNTEESSNYLKRIWQHLDASGRGGKGLSGGGGPGGLLSLGIGMPSLDSVGKIFDNITSVWEDTTSAVRDEWETVRTWVTESVWPTMSESVLMPIWDGFNNSLLIPIRQGWNSVIGWVSETTWAGLKESVLMPIWNGFNNSLLIPIRQGWNSAIGWVSETVWPALKESVLMPIWDTFNTLLLIPIRQGWDSAKSWVVDTVWPALKESALMPIWDGFNRMLLIPIRQGWLSAVQWVTTTAWPAIKAEVFAPVKRSVDGVITYLRSQWSDFISWMRNLVIPAPRQAPAPVRPGARPPGNSSPPSNAPRRPRGVPSHYIWDPILGQWVDPNNPPEAHAGGIVRGRPGGTMVKVGERSKDEVIMPLTPGMSGGGGGASIVNHFYGDNYSEDFDRKVKEAVREVLSSGSVSQELKLAVN